MRYILLVVVLFIFSGCIVEKKPAITEYRLSTKNITIQSNANGCKDKTLKIAKAFSSASLRSLQMSYTQDDNKVFSYSKANWNESPNHSIHQKIFSNIRDSKLFKNVNLSTSKSRYDLVLEINIEDFLQHYSTDLKKSYADVRISLNLINSKKSNIIASEVFTAKVDVKTMDANGGVEALDSALENILSKNIEWLTGVCK